MGIQEENRVDTIEAMNYWIKFSICIVVVGRGDEALILLWS